MLEIRRIQTNFINLNSYFDYTDKFNELIKDDFGIILPEYMAEELKKSLKHVENSVHHQELAETLQFYWLIRGSMPGLYRSKCGMPVCNSSQGFCEDLPFEYEEGMIENICLILEKQFWEVIFSIYVGSYRSVRSSLRHMLQLTCWMTQSIVNKGFFTEKPEDSNESMDLYEFQQFLHENEQRYNAKHKVPKQFDDKQKSDQIEKKFPRPPEGITLKKLPNDFPLHFIKSENFNGRPAIKELYSELSKHVHISNFKQIKLGIGKSEFLPSHKINEFHDCLKIIFRTHGIIFSLLIMAGYYDLRHYSVSNAYDFIDNILKESKKYKMQFKGAQKILENFIKNIDKVEIARDRKNQEFWQEGIFDDDTWTKNIWKPPIWEEQ